MVSVGMGLFVGTGAAVSTAVTLVVIVYISGSGTAPKTCSDITKHTDDLRFLLDGNWTQSLHIGRTKSHKECHDLNVYEVCRNQINYERAETETASDPNDVYKWTTHWSLLADSDISTGLFSLMGDFSTYMKQDMEDEDVKYAIEKTGYSDYLVLWRCSNDEITDVFAYLKDAGDADLLDNVVKKEVRTMATIANQKIHHCRRE